MKKLMMLFAVAVATVSVHAATMTWSVLNVIGPSGSDAPVGTIVALYAAGTEYDHAKAVSGELAPAYTSTAVAQGTTGATRISESGVGSYSAGQTASFYAVVYDASTIAGAQNYVISDVMSATVGANGANITLAFGNMKGTTTANKFLTGLNNGWSSASGGGDIPEPTSALLLLMGGAMLALRRKRS